ncbi:DUF2550 family protein [Lawsonella clevelandensis]|uniref:DUF2550 domain-containing protein n=1 Tax=Lawsonella clevelandensis TaxID=1528099 RepID=A0A5E3ZVD6_9ACTN|nr:DUF2550 family protein [Lawsonella clevelandensis]MDU7193484.1 DUF2550 family protein [Lawsonella clevelandensis]VHN99904.1 hypothetical protein LC603019_00318 [Lawsonella clevelandensis]
MWWSGIVAVSVVLIALAVASYFFYCHMTALQDKGTGVLMRVRPAEGEHGWRHGILVYEENRVRFYKLLKFVDRKAFDLNRDEIHILACRSPHGLEIRLMDETTRIVAITGCDPEVELALSPSAHAALLSWLESRPSKRLYQQGL